MNFISGQRAKGGAHTNMWQRHQSNQATTTSVSVREKGLQGIFGGYVGRGNPK